jgi:hypothetical protein
VEGLLLFSLAIEQLVPEKEENYTEARRQTKAFLCINLLARALQEIGGVELPWK